MTQYLSRRDNKTMMQVFAEHDKYGTVDIRYMNGAKEGTTSTISSGTLKRWWKEVEYTCIGDEALEILGGGDAKEIVDKIDNGEIQMQDHDDEYIAEIMQQKKDLGIEITPINPDEVEIVDTESHLTDDEYAKIGLEIAEQAKKKAKDHKNTQEMQDVMTTLTNSGFDVSVVNGLPKTIMIKKIGQLALSKNGYRLKANKTFTFTVEVPYEETKNYNKVVADTLEDILKIIK